MWQRERLNYQVLLLLVVHKYNGEHVSRWYIIELPDFVIIGSMGAVIQNTEKTHTSLWKLETQD